MTECLIDTNILLRYLLKDNPVQSKYSRELFLKAKNKEIIIYIPQLIFIEAIYVLIKVYKQQKVNITTVLRKFINLEYLEVEKRAETGYALEIFENNNISITDAILFTDAKLSGKTLLTFDKKLKNI